MTTQPRMSAHIGRLQIRTLEARKRRGSGTGRGRSAEPPMDTEVTQADEERDEQGRPHFYPFPLRAAGERDD